MSNSKQPEYDMAKVQGLFVGYRKFAVDREWLRLGEPQQQGKYKVFPVEAVLAAEKLNEFQLWLKPRLEKKRAQHHHFLIPFL